MEVQHLSKYEREASSEEDEEPPGGKEVVTATLPGGAQVLVMCLCRGRVKGLL